MIILSSMLSVLFPMYSAIITSVRALLVELKNKFNLVSHTCAFHFFFKSPQKVMGPALTEVQGEIQTVGEKTVCGKSSSAVCTKEKWTPNGFRRVQRAVQVLNWRGLQTGAAGSSK